MSMPRQLTREQKLGKAPQGPALREPPRQPEPELEQLPDPAEQLVMPTAPEPVSLRPGAVRTTIALALSYVPAQGNKTAGYALETFQIDFDAEGVPRIAAHERSNPTDRGNAANIYRQACGYRIQHSSQDLQIVREKSDQLPGRRDGERSDEDCALDYLARRVQAGEIRSEYILDPATPKSVRDVIVARVKSRGLHAWIEGHSLIAVLPRERRQAVR